MNVKPEKINLSQEFLDDPKKSLCELAKDYDCDLGFLVADDHVGFFKKQDDGWVFPGDLGTILTAGQFSHIQQVYVFGKTAQIQVWRSAINTFNASLIRESPSGPVEEGWVAMETIDEIYYLWGDAQDGFSTPGFTRLQEENRGFTVEVPLPVALNHQVGLRVRQYIQGDADGQLFIAFSRLTGLTEIS